MTTVKLYSFNFSNSKTYIFASIFVIGNILLPQMAHLIPQGGFIFLPIYFFTLIAAYKYGIHVGLLTAVMSPIVNHLFFGMPPIAVLPAILFKSIVLAIAAAFAAQYFKKVSILAILLAVVAYQLIGMVFELIITQNLNLALQNIRLGIPGILIQIIGGFAVLKAIEKI